MLFRLGYLTHPTNTKTPLVSGMRNFHGSIPREPRGYALQGCKQVSGPGYVTCRSAATAEGRQDFEPTPGPLRLHQFFPAVPMLDV